MNAICRDTPVATFRAREGKEELARINRLTGLQFESLPHSLLQEPAHRPPAKECVVMRMPEAASRHSR